jgi:hypothetical protein
MIFHMIGFLCVRCTLHKEDKGLLDETNRVLESMQKYAWVVPSARGITTVTPWIREHNQK